MVVGAIALAYSFQSQRRDDTRLFKELFTEFNSRYDKLNDNLNRISDHPVGELSIEDRLILFDYFNLCGEEYMFNELGYIESSACESWLAGMKGYYAADVIRREWDRELMTGSYYGMQAEMLRS